MTKHKRLFIPGPTEVSEKMLRAMGTPMIGHRSSEFSELYNRVSPKLKKLLYTEGDVFLSTSSATGIMEGALRNLTTKKVLNCMCGAFSDRWYDISVDNGLPADKLQVEWGMAVKPEMVDQCLKTGQYDVVAFVHNETSTGVMNPLAEVAEVVRKYPDVCFVVDAVSSMSGVKIEVDKLGIDVCLAGVQKAFALPPGLTVFSVSAKALKKAQEVKTRGHYFNFLEFKKYHDKGQTPNTPSISHIYALDQQLDNFFAEGLSARFERHVKLAQRCRAWAMERFALFPEPGYESITMTAAKNTRGISIPDLNKELAKKYVVISNGYGKLKDKTFRIAHMGDTTMRELDELLGWIDEIVG